MTKNEKNKKVPFNVLRKGTINGLLGLTLSVGSLSLAGCSNGKDGESGSKWYSGTTNVEQVTTGVDGDYYYDTDDYKLYQKEDGVWVLKVENFGKQGETGAQGEKGETGEQGPKGDTGAQGEKGETGEQGPKGEKGDTGATGAQGEAGKDGSNVYLGYDGYIWQDGLKTSFKLEQDTTGRKNIVEDTIGAYTTMKYFAGEYLDLSTNTIALMSNFKPNAKLTQYSGTKITEIQVVAEIAGTLHIGTAKVTDVVTSRTSGSTLTTKTSEFNLVAGVNTITLDLTVADDETIVLGGSGSSAKVYVVKGIPVDDEAGNYALVNGSENTGVISKTGDYADTLAVRVKAEISIASEVAIFENISTKYPANGSELNTVYLTNAPYRYLDNSKFAGKTITKIGAIVRENNAASGEQPYMTVYKHKISQTTNFSGVGTAIKIYFPADTKANTWAYADCNIELAEDETIAFGANSGDTLAWGYSTKKETSEFNFQDNKSETKVDYQLLFDVYFENEIASVWKTHLDMLEEAEQDAIQTIKETALRGILEGENLSILGDSISTFGGYSNDSTNTNDTIGNNAIYYSGTNNGITDVNETWWKQIANKTGMNVLVNNSYSGDKVTNYGQTRCEQLHDNTGDNAGTNPDIIAVYLGINDFDGGVNADVFKTSYDAMIGKIVAKYDSADVYLFTLLPNNVKRDDATLLAYNNVIWKIAEKYGCSVVDLYNDSGITVENMASYTNASDCLHPNMAGMDKMTDCFWEVLYKNYANTAE